MQKKYCWILLDIYRECGETAEVLILILMLANICEKQFQYKETRQLYKKSIIIMRETGDKEGEAYASGKFGVMSHCLGEYEKAKEYFEKALAITMEIGDRNKEASCYGNLGTVLKSIGEYDEAKEYLEKALAIKIEIGDRTGEAVCYGNLGAMF